MNTQGMVPMKLGQAKLVKEYIKLLHIVDLDAYKLTIDNIEDSLKVANNNDNLGNIKELSNLKFTELRNKFKILYPHARTKRGLVNGLGSIIKGITGNMDDTDAQNIKNFIETTKLNEHDLNNQFNSQIALNKQMIDRFKNITNFIDNQQKTISQNLKLNNKILTNKIQVEEENFRYMQYIYQVNYNIDMLTNHLNDILDSITLAKLNVISKQILHPSELESINLILKNQSFYIKSTEQIYELLELEACYLDNKIIFNVKIPKFHNNSYEFIHSILLPINSTKYINNPYPYILYNKQQIYYLTEKCKSIEHQFICTKFDKEESTNSSNCIGNILKSEKAHCSLTEHSKYQTISQPEENYILLINIPETNISTTCGFKNKIIQGTLLLHYVNCTITINEIQYTNKWNQYWDSIYLIPVAFSEINATKILQPISLETLSNYHMENYHAIDLLQIKGQHRDYVLFGTVIILLLIILFGIGKILIRKLQPKESIQINDPVHTPGAPTTESKFKLNWSSPI